MQFQDQHCLQDRRWPSDIQANETNVTQHMQIQTQITVITTKTNNLDKLGVIQQS